MVISSMTSSDFLSGFLLDFTLFGLYHSLRWVWATDRIRSLLFHRLLSQHPVLSTPEGSWRLHFQVLHRFHGLHPDSMGSAPSFSRCRADVSTLQDSLQCCGLLFCSFFSKGYNASAQPVARLHRLLATWPPVSYHDQTFTG
jgi:hypothetical protein